jgi:xeroderma pigmentosum group C-complementing protein
MQDSAISDTAAPNHDTSVVADNSPAGDEHDSDHGSLLSHDPEDDDAEPDWLESD